MFKFEVKKNERSKKINEAFEKVKQDIVNLLKKAKDVKLEPGKAIYILEDKNKFRELANNCGLAMSTFRVHLTKITDDNLKIIANENSGTIKIVKK